VAERSEAALVLHAAAIPLYPGAPEAARSGVRTGGDARNRQYLEGHARIAPDVEDGVAALAVDPQTSGGLLAAVDPAALDRLGGAGFVAVGEVTDGPAGVELLA
jgi:selenide, water dikinase